MCSIDVLVGGMQMENSVGLDMLLSREDIWGEFGELFCQNPCDLVGC